MPMSEQRRPVHTDIEPALDRPKASVVIPHYNDFENLQLCLEFLEKQTLPSSDFEVVVADNDSSVGFEAVVRGVRQRAKVVLARERGAGPARNVGADASTGEVLVFTDSDCRPGEQFLSAGLDMLELFDIVGGAIRVTANDPKNLSPVEAFELVFAFRNELYVKKRHFSVTAALFIPRWIFQAVGPFRNGVSEDMDWCARARRMGFRIGYASHSLIEHPARRKWPDFVRKHKRLANESLNMAREKRFGTLMWVLRSFPVLASIIPHSIEILQSRKLGSAKDRWNAIQVLVAIRTLRFIWAYQGLFQPKSLAGGV
jgi:GT2 family glycosyltransferase